MTTLGSFGLSFSFSIIMFTISFFISFVRKIMGSFQQRFVQTLSLVISQYWLYESEIFLWLLVAIMFMTFCLLSLFLISKGIPLWDLLTMTPWLICFALVFSAISTTLLVSSISLLFKMILLLMESLPSDFEYSSGSGGNSPSSPSMASSEQVKNFVHMYEDSFDSQLRDKGYKNFQRLNFNYGEHQFQYSDYSDFTSRVSEKLLTYSNTFFQKLGNNPNSQSSKFMIRNYNKLFLKYLKSELKSLYSKKVT